LTLHLKLGTIVDVNEITVRLFELFQSSVYSDLVEWDEVSTKEKVTQLINQGPESGGIVLLYHDTELVGLIGFSHMMQLFNQNHKTAVELAFWITPEYRTRSSIKKLLGAYRYWAKRVGCHSILMGKLKNKNEVESFTIRRL
jgi:RimJ/RimL family protein N-acetyltransferase